MKAIFLDIDGVLCTPLSFWLNRFLRKPLECQVFDPVALFWLQRLVKKSGALVVLSSSWRDGLTAGDAQYHAIIENLFRRLERNRTPLADVTPLEKNGEKGQEIQQWLRCNPCCSYVILDDNDLFSSVPSIKAHWVAIPYSGGLRRKEYRAALRFLLEK